MGIPMFSTVMILLFRCGDVSAERQTRHVSRTHTTLQAGLRPFTFFRAELAVGAKAPHDCLTSCLVGPALRGGALAISSSPISDDPHKNNGSGSRRRNLIIGGIVGTLIGVPLVAEGYSRSGGVSGVAGLADPARGWSKVETATVVFHGAGGPDQYTDQLMKSLAEASRTDGSAYGALVDWSAVSSNILQASFSGQRIGRSIAAELLSKASTLKSLHLIGISVGAFAADAACTEAKELVGASGRSLYMQLTLLDPFTQRGVLDPTYGNRNFGRYADYAQQYLNTDDPVPSTNTPLARCTVFDVTNLRPADVFGHDWPLAYYAKSGKVGFVSTAEKQPPGSLIVVAAR